MKPKKERLRVRVRVFAVDLHRVAVDRRDERTKCDADNERYAARR